MKHRVILSVLSALAAFALAASLSLPARSATSAMDVVNKVVVASEAIDASALRGLYTDNAVFIDEGPIVIYGPNVGVDWANRVNKAFSERHMSHFKATASKPAVVQISAKGAYVVVPMELNAQIGATKHYHETGAFTFTLVRQAGVWKITSQVWTVLTKVIG
ncbi:MAG TPA: nuclear transport factor 2 family protein [Candidatus Baltobacteraceae bacterium]|nr:nuclear transport factor 2 family protein [Candidatus Baltobacteraceae bacterium]